jgi:predicted oxidoreductase
MTDYSIREAAKLVGVDHKTLRRRLHEQPGADGRRPSEALPNAYLVGREWRIPEGDLTAAGWRNQPVEVMMSRPPEFLENDDLREALYEAEKRAGVAEALVDEMRARLADKDEIIAAKDAVIEALRGES